MADPVATFWAVLMGLFAINLAVSFIPQLKIKKNWKARIGVDATLGSTEIAVMVFLPAYLGIPPLETLITVILAALIVVSVIAQVIKGIRLGRQTTDGIIDLD